jgi:hypothetical protein
MTSPITPDVNVVARLSWICASAVALVLLLPTEASATPFHAISSAYACNTCHAEPLGWFNPEARAQRRCNLDCQGCHIVPTGMGMRTPLGVYYAREELPTWGARPSSFSNPERLLTNPNAPRAGTYDLLQGGFDGWWPGEVDHRTVDDRLGKIDASPVWQAGADFRSMVIVPTSDTDARAIAAFPMEIQGYVAAHPLSNLTAYLDVGIQGDQDRYVNDGLLFDDYIWVREIMVMLHDLPFSSYLRAGRISPAYGWRLPDHTAYTRVGLGHDQNRHGYGLEVGIAPNEWWGNLSVAYQGVDKWPGEVATMIEGVGIYGQGGWRGLGFTLGGSAQMFSGADGYSDNMLGLMWAVNLSPIVYLAQADMRHLVRGADQNGATSLVALHEIQVRNVVRGLSPHVRYEWIDTNVKFLDDHAQRVSLGAEWFPLSYLSLDATFRYELRAASAQNDTSELLFQLHGFF